MVGSLGLQPFLEDVLAVAGSFASSAHFYYGEDHEIWRVLAFA